MDRSMTESTTLLNSQIGFLDTHVALIHIPRSSCPIFLHAISQLLLHNDRRDEDGNILQPGRHWQFWHPFVNISLTPNECSVVCPREDAERLFRPILSSLDQAVRNAVSISEEDFSVIMIGGEGLEAGQRVLDLTSPLAMAGISIFFITSYWSDFILVPHRARSRVIHALEDRGFIFEAEANSEAGHMANPMSPLLHRRNDSATSAYDFPITPGTPPPASVSELQTKTFNTLRRNKIAPYVDRDIELVTCAGVKDTMASKAASHSIESKIQLGLVKCLTNSPPPKFLSVTLTDSESASLTMEKELLPLFSDEREDLLLGKDGPEQIPITLDLHELPLESTGIVCGVASRLTEGMRGRIGRELFNMSYLSTARAGHVIVYEDELEDVMDSLRGAQQNGEVNGIDGHGRDGR